MDARDKAIAAGAVKLAWWQFGPLAQVMNDAAKKETVERAAIVVEAIIPVLLDEIEKRIEAAALDLWVVRRMGDGYNSLLAKDNEELAREYADVVRRFRAEWEQR